MRAEGQLNIKMEEQMWWSGLHEEDLPLQRIREQSLNNKGQTKKIQRFSFVYDSLRDPFSFSSS